MAIDELLDEHEQSERARNWLRDNAAGLIGGVALGLAAIWAYNTWQAKAEVARMQAGDAYQAVLNDVEAGKLKEAQAGIAKLKGSAYSVLAGLHIAKAQLDAGQRDAAIATLRAINAGDSALAPVVAQRLAKLLIDAGKAEEALKLLANVDDAAGYETRADALFALGRLPQARDDYNKALSKLDVAAPQRGLIELKLSQAGGTPAKNESAS